MDVIDYIMAEEINRDRGPGYMGISPPVETEKARLMFVERYGYPPEEVIEEYMNQLVGPVRGLGLQESPDDPRIFNRKQADGSYRPISEFFDQGVQDGEN